MDYRQSLFVWVFKLQQVNFTSQFKSYYTQFFIFFISFPLVWLQLLSQLLFDNNHDICNHKITVCKICWIVGNRLFPFIWNRDTPINLNLFGWFIDLNYLWMVLPLTTPTWSSINRISSLIFDQVYLFLNTFTERTQVHLWSLQIWTSD